jgi:hypothetical protein
MVEINQSLDLGKLDKPMCCVVELAIEPPRPDFGMNMIRPLQQVTLRPDKVSSHGLIRLGETQGDEANCWIRPEHIKVVEILGSASEANGNWEVTPLAKAA